MQSTHTQIRSNIETFQDDSITPYSDDTERIESSTNSDSQDYNPVYQHIDDSHLGVNPDYNVTTSEERVSFSDSQDHNYAVYQQSHSYIDDSHLGVSPTLNMNDRISTEQIDNGNYRDYNVRDNPHYSIRMDNALNYNTADRRFFFFRPINDVYVYDVECEEIPFDIVVKTLNKSLINKENMQINENEIIFFYANQYTNKSYKITCKIVSPFSIAKYLNKNIYGIEIQANVERELLKLTPEQKQNLEFHLSQYLDNYLII